MSRFRRPASLWPLTLIIIVVIWILILAVLIYRGPRLKPAGTALPTPPTPNLINPAPTG